MRHLAFLTLLLNTACYTAPRRYFSQCGQDKFVNEHFFHNKRNGVFVDIGAHNGITISNTYFFEKYLGWTGICFEPLPEEFERLKHNRNCTCINGCISDFNGPSQFLKISSRTWTQMLSGLVNKYDPRHAQRVDREVREFGGKKEVIEVMCYKLNDILEQYNMYTIDYLSIDTEGGEFDILKTIDFDRFDIEIIDVENNYKDIGSEIRTFMESNGYKYYGPVEGDDIYRKVRN